MKISNEHKINLICVAIALTCFAIDYIDGGLFGDKVFNGLILWFVIGFSFGMIIQNYKENKK